MDWKLSLMLLVTAAAVCEVRGQSLAELAKMAGINLKDVAGEAFDKEEATTAGYGLRGLLGRAGLLGSSLSASASNTPSMKSASSSSSPSSASSSPSLSSTPCGNCGNCPSCLMKQMKLLNQDFGGYPSGSESGYPGMMGQLSHMGLGGDAETLNAMNSAYASEMSGMPPAFGGLGAGAANFMPTDSYAPFVGAPSVMSESGLSGGYEQYPETMAMQRYPLQEEEPPRAYPMPDRTRSRYSAPVQRPIEYEQDQPQGGEEGGPGEHGPPVAQYEQRQPEEESPQGYTGNQEVGGGDEQQSPYARQPESDQEAPQSEHRAGGGGGYPGSEYARSQSYFDKK